MNVRGDLDGLGWHGVWGGDEGWRSGVEVEAVAADDLSGGITHQLAWGGYVGTLRHGWVTPHHGGDDVDRPVLGRRKVGDIPEGGDEGGDGGAIRQRDVSDAPPDNGDSGDGAGWGDHGIADGDGMRGEVDERAHGVCVSEDTFHRRRIRRRCLANIDQLRV